MATNSREVEVELADSEIVGVPAGIYHLWVTTDVTVSGRNTRGNYSSRASDPDEYYGESIEVESKLVSLQLTDIGGDFVKEMSRQEWYNTSSQNFDQIVEYAMDLAEAEYLAQSHKD